MKNLRRTMLFMPGNNPSMIQNADILGADSIILDLEDAVSLTEKDSARILVREAIKTLNFENVELIVRINPIDTMFAEKDIIAIGKVKPDTILVPKATEEDIIKVSEMLDQIEDEMKFNKGEIKLIALIESAYGVENVYNIIKASERVNGVLLGGEDLAADMGIKRTKEGNEVFYARNKVATACKALRVSSIDTPFTDTNDCIGLKEDTRKAKSLGMTGKAAINPRQVDDIHEVYSPSEGEINHAKRVVEAKDKAESEGLGVFSLDGKMIDAPIINRAKATLELADILGLL